MQCLIVAGDPVIGFMVEQAAAQVGCESRTVENPTAALTLAKQGGMDVAVVDHAPPLSDGVAWSEALHQDETGRQVRVILLAVADDPFDLRRMTDAGIDDLLVKPFQAIELELRLQASERILDLACEVESHKRALEAMATHDALTGVLNDKAILEALRRESDRAVRDGTPLSVVVAEVDGLGIIRDWTGTEAADATLVEVAARIRANLRPYDSLGRAGHSGFMVALPKCDMDRAVTVAQRILASVAGAPVKGGGRMVSVTVSLGVARLEPGDAGRVDRLAASATAALVGARSAGVNRVATR